MGNLRRRWAGSGGFLAVMAIVIFAVTVGAATLDGSRAGSSAPITPSRPAGGTQPLGANSWSPLTSMPSPRESMGTATDTDGRIYAIGGDDTTGELSSVVLYTPASGKWT